VNPHALRRGAAEPPRKVSLARFFRHRADALRVGSGDALRPGPFQHGKDHGLIFLNALDLRLAMLNPSCATGRPRRPGSRVSLLILNPSQYPGARFLVVSGAKSVAAEDGGPKANQLARGVLR